MCGITGYIGHKQAAPILLDGLTKLEYRGYDSAGLCRVPSASVTPDGLPTESPLRTMHTLTSLWIMRLWVFTTVSLRTTRN